MSRVVSRRVVWGPAARFVLGVAQRMAGGTVGQAVPVLGRGSGCKTSTRRRTRRRPTTRMALVALMEKAADADRVRDLLAFAAERIVDAGVETLTGAAKGLRGALREAPPRNGCRERASDTRAGRVELVIPRLRKGSCIMG